MEKRKRFCDGDEGGEGRRKKDERPRNRLDRMTEMIFRILRFLFIPVTISFFFASVPRLPAISLLSEKQDLCFS
jgi:hypothetical protein